MTAKTDFPQLPAALADAALIDGPTCAAAGDVSLSWWYDSVRNGSAPQPVIREPRFSRWRLVDVARFWREFAESGADDGRVTLQATKASAKARSNARAKRHAAQDGE
jgi:predicted DNA-binding transcriptional regulator AlpA